MEVKLLGPLEAYENGRSVVPTAGKPRQILALLALDAGQVVTVSTLIDELWRTRPPRSALTTLQTYIMHLRRLLRAAGDEDYDQSKDVLVTRSGGYLLDIGDAVDVREYERLSTAGLRAAEGGNLASASDLLRSALGVWRGDALADVPVGLRLSIEVIRLSESRLGVLKQCIDVDLRLGRHYALLSELAKLNASYPMHEDLCAQFMIALYRSGQQWRALDVYKKLRDTLVAELGVEPSAQLRQLQWAILRSDPSLNSTTVSGIGHQESFAM